MFGIEKRRTYNALRKHISDYFPSHPIHEHKWNDGPIAKILPRFSILEVAPGPKNNLWTYFSLGAWEVKHKDSGTIEFMLVTPERDKQHFLSLAMTAFYHVSNPLGVGHTFPIGEPWLEGSKCDHMLVSRPYVYSPELEVCNLSNQHVHFLWLLPITKAERDYKSKNGLEALEKIFEESEVEYWKIARESLV